MVGPSMISSYNYNSFALKSSTPSTIKFLCSYGGKIIPRYPDGKLRYHGGQTRVLAVDRSISFSELVRKLAEMCGALTVSLRCQLPTEDMDALVSITSDEDLANLIEEYDRGDSSSPSTTTSFKVRAFLSTPKSSTVAANKLSPTSSLASSSSSSSTNDATITVTSPKLLATYMSAKPPRVPKCVHQTMSRPVTVVGYPCQYGPSTAKGHPHYSPAGKNSSPIYLIHHGNHWQ